MRYQLAVVLGLVAVECVSGCGRDQSDDAAGHVNGRKGSDAGKVVRIATSLMQLIANPEKYDGAEARLAGFLVMSQPDRPFASLHLNREDAEMVLGANLQISFARCDDRVPLDPLIPPELAFRSNGKYVALTGRFLADPRDQTSVGVVCDITELGERGEPSQRKVESDPDGITPMPAGGAKFK